METKQYDGKCLKNDKNIKMKTSDKKAPVTPVCKPWPTEGQQAQLSRLSAWGSVVLVLLTMSLK